MSRVPISRRLLQKASEAGAGRVFASLNITLGAAVPARDASAVMHSSRKRKMALSCEDFQFYGNTLCSQRIDLRRAVKDADCSTAAPVDAGCAGIIGGGGSKGSWVARQTDMTVCRLDFGDACEICMHSNQPLKNLNVVAELVVTVMSSDYSSSDGSDGMDISHHSICWTIMPLTSPSLSSGLQQSAKAKLAHFPVFAGSPRLLLLLGTNTRVLSKKALLPGGAMAITVQRHNHAPTQKAIEDKIFSMLRLNELSLLSQVLPQTQVTGLPGAPDPATCVLRLNRVRVWFGGQGSAISLKKFYLDLARRTVARDKTLLARVVAAQNDLRLILRAHLHNGHKALMPDTSASVELLPALEMYSAGDTSFEGMADINKWSAKDPLLVPGYVPHPLSAVVLSLFLSGGRDTADAAWELCVGWAPLVPCTQTHSNGQIHTSPETCKGLMLGSWRVPFRYQTLQSLPSYIPPEVTAALNDRKAGVDALEVPNALCVGLHLEAFDSAYPVAKHALENTVCGPSPTTSVDDVYQDALGGREVQMGAGVMAEDVMLACDPSPDLELKKAEETLAQGLSGSWRESSPEKAGSDCARFSLNTSRAESIVANIRNAIAAPSVQKKAESPARHPGVTCDESTWKGEGKTVALSPANVVAKITSSLLFAEQGRSEDGAEGSTISMESMVSDVSGIGSSDMDVDGSSFLSSVLPSVDDYAMDDGKKDVDHKNPEEGVHDAVARLLQCAVRAWRARRQREMRMMTKMVIHSDSLLEDGDTLQEEEEEGQIIFSSDDSACFSQPEIAALPSQADAEQGSEPGLLAVFQLHTEQDMAALTVQGAVRVWFARRETVRLLSMLQDRRVEEAVMTLQCAVRVRRARVEAASRRQEIRQEIRQNRRQRRRVAALMQQKQQQQQQQEFQRVDTQASQTVVDSSQIAIAVAVPVADVAPDATPVAAAGAPDSCGRVGVQASNKRDLEMRLLRNIHMEVNNTQVVPRCLFPTSPLTSDTKTVNRRLCLSGKKAKTLKKDLGQASGAGSNMTSVHVASLQKASGALARVGLNSSGCAQAADTPSVQKIPFHAMQAETEPDQHLDNPQMPTASGATHASERRLRVNVDWAAVTKAPHTPAERNRLAFLEKRLAELESMDAESKEGQLSEIEKVRHVQEPLVREVQLSTANVVKVSDAAMQTHTSMVYSATTPLSVAAAQDLVVKNEPVACTTPSPCFAIGTPETPTSLTTKDYISPTRQSCRVKVLPPRHGGARVVKSLGEALDTAFLPMSLPTPPKRGRLAAACTGTVVCVQTQGVGSNGADKALRVDVTQSRERSQAEGTKTATESEAVATQTSLDVDFATDDSKTTCASARTEVPAHVFSSDVPTEELAVPGAAVATAVDATWQSVDTDTSEILATPGQAALPVVFEAISTDDAFPHAINTTLHSVQPQSAWQSRSAAVQTEETKARKEVSGRQDNMEAKAQQLLATVMALGEMEEEEDDSGEISMLLHNEHGSDPQCATQDTQPRVTTDLMAVATRLASTAEGEYQHTEDPRTQPCLHDGVTSVGGAATRGHDHSLYPMSLTSANLLKLQAFAQHEHAALEVAAADDFFADAVAAAADADAAGFSLLDDSRNSAAVPHALDFSSTEGATAEEAPENSQMSAAPDNVSAPECSLSFVDHSSFLAPRSPLRARHEVLSVVELAEDHVIYGTERACDDSELREECCQELITESIFLDSKNNLWSDRGDEHTSMRQLEQVRHDLNAHLKGHARRTAELRDAVMAKKRQVLAASVLCTHVRCCLEGLRGRMHMQTARWHAKMEAELARARQSQQEVARIALYASLRRAPVRQGYRRRISARSICFAVQAMRVRLLVEGLRVQEMAGRILQAGVRRALTPSQESIAWSLHAKRMREFMRRAANPDSRPTLSTMSPNALVLTPKNDNDSPDDASAACTTSAKAWSLLGSQKSPSAPRRLKKPLVPLPRKSSTAVAAAACQPPGNTPLSPQPPSATTGGFTTPPTTKKGLKATDDVNFADRCSAPSSNDHAAEELKSVCTDTSDILNDSCSSEQRGRADVMATPSGSDLPGMAPVLMRKEPVAVRAARSVSKDVDGLCGGLIAMPDGGASLTFKAGALAHRQLIGMRIEPFPPAVANDKNTGARRVLVSDVVILSPSGIEFDAPVMLELPLKPQLLTHHGRSHLGIFKYNPQTCDWDEKCGAVLGEKGKGYPVLRLPIWSFSSYAALEIFTVAPPADQGGGAEAATASAATAAVAEPEAEEVEDEYDDDDFEDDEIEESPGKAGATRPQVAAASDATGKEDSASGLVPPSPSKAAWSKEDQDADARKKMEEEAIAAKILEEEAAAAAKDKTGAESTTQEAERWASEEAARARKKEEDSKARAAADASEKERLQEEEAAQKKAAAAAAEEVEKKRIEDEEVAKKLEQAAKEKKQKEEEEAAAAAAEKKRMKDEEAAKKLEQAAKEKKQKEEEEAAAAAAEKKRMEDEEAAKKLEQAAKEKKQKEEEEAAAEKKRMEDEEAAKKLEHAAKEKKQKDEEEAAAEKKRMEDEEAAKKLEHAAKEKKQKDEEEAAAEKKRMEDEEAAKKLEQAAKEKKQKEEEEAAAKEKKQKEEQEAAAAAAEKKRMEDEEAAKKLEQAAKEKKQKEEEEAAAAAAEKKRMEDEEAAKRLEQAAKEKKQKEEEEAAAKEKKQKEEQEAAAAVAEKKRIEDDEAAKKLEQAVKEKKQKDEEEAAAAAAAAAEKKRIEDEEAAKKLEQAAKEKKQKDEEEAAAEKKRIEDEEAARLFRDQAAERKKDEEAAKAAKKEEQDQLDMLEAKRKEAAAAADRARQRAQIEEREEERLRTLTPEEKAVREALVRSQTVSVSASSSPGKSSVAVTRATRARLHTLAPGATGGNPDVEGTGSLSELPKWIPRYYYPVVHVNAAAHEFPAPELSMEQHDELKCNHIVLQFLAFGVPPRPDVTSVVFKITFFDFAEVKTPALTILRGASGAPAPLQVPTTAPPGSPSKLYVKPSYPANNAEEAASPLTLTYSVGANGDNVDDAFVRYLQHGALEIAAFDAQSTMPLGNARVETRPLLREGRRALQMVADYPLTDPLAEPLLTGPVSSFENAGEGPTPAKTGAGGMTLMLRIFNFGGRVDESEGAHKNVHLSVAQPAFSSVLRNSADLSSEVHRKASILWRSLALVVCRQAELVAHLHKSEACSAKELEDAIFAAGLPLTLHQAGEVSAYLAREFGLVDAEGHTGRGGVGGLIDISRIQPAFVSTVQANSQMLQSKQTSSEEVEELAGKLLQLMAARYGSLDRAWTLAANDDQIGIKEVDEMISHLGEDTRRDMAPVRDGLLYCLGARDGSNVGEIEFNYFFDIRVRGRGGALAPQQGGAEQDERRKLVRWRRTERVRNKITSVQHAKVNGGDEMAAIEERLQLLEAARALRERHKTQKISEFLQTTTGDSRQRVAVEAPFGEARYFAHVVTNPFENPRMLEVTSADLKTLTAVSDEIELAWARQCLHLQASGSDFGSAEVAARTDKGTWQVLVSGGAKVTLVFKVRCLAPVPPGSRAVQGAPTAIGGTSSTPWVGGCRMVNQSALHTVMMTIAAKKHGHADEMLARVQVRVATRAPVLDRTLRFFNGSHEPFERHVVMAVGAGKAGASRVVAAHRLAEWRRPPGGAISAGFSAWCTAEEASMRALRREDGLNEVHVNNRGLAPGESDTFDVLVYADNYYSSLVSILRCHVTYYARLPLKGMLGHAAPAAASYRLRTLTAAQADAAKVTCHTSHPHALECSITETEDVAVKLDVLFRPKVVGPLNALVLAVEDSRLVTGAIVSAVAGRPIISQRYKVRVAAGKSVCKKISYTNTYLERRKFRFRTNSPQILTLRGPGVNHDGSRDLDLHAGEHGFLSMRIIAPEISENATDRKTEAEALVFITSMEVAGAGVAPGAEQNEECLSIIARAVAGDGEKTPFGATPTVSPEKPI